MKIISHRRNTIEELLATPRSYGVEVDIRSFDGQLIIQHDPFKKGESFASWITNYQHKTLILNVKEEGLEPHLIALLEQQNISDYFFLDQSFPFLIKSANLGERRCAVRVSEFESIETALALSGKIEWVWVDCFTKFPLSYTDFMQLHKAGFKLCLVSPELQGRSAEIEISKLSQLLIDQSIVMDAVCTKRPDIWEQIQTS